GDLESVTVKTNAAIYDQHPGVEEGCEPLEGPDLGGAVVCFWADRYSFGVFAAYALHVSNLDTRRVLEVMDDLRARSVVGPARACFPVCSMPTVRPSPLPSPTSPSPSPSPSVVITATGSNLTATA